jgi:hypothetical protein
MQISLEISVVPPGLSAILSTLVANAEFNTANNKVDSGQDC